MQTWQLWRQGEPWLKGFNCTWLYWVCTCNFNSVSPIYIGIRGNTLFLAHSVAVCQFHGVSTCTTRWLFHKCSVVKIVVGLTSSCKIPSPSSGQTWMAWKHKDLLGEHASSPTPKLSESCAVPGHRLWPGDANVPLLAHQIFFWTISPKLQGFTFLYASIIPF